MKRRALVLFLLAPFFGEVLSGSTPPLQFVDPRMFVYLFALYGSGAVIARELARRRGRSWANLLLFGAAYGVLEEGLVVTSWFNPHWPDLLALHQQGTVLGVNWIWAIGLTMYHAVVSVTVPVLVTETLFGDDGSRPWLGRLGLTGLCLLLAAASAFGLLVFGFVFFRAVGYAHPPASYPLAAIVAVALVIAGLRVRFPRSPAAPAPPPGLWRLRLAALGATAAWFGGEYVLPNLRLPGIVPCLFLVGLALVAWTAVSRWSASAGWGAGQRLALASGVTGFFLLLAPVIEFGPHPGGKPTAGMTLVALLTLAALAWLSRRRAVAGASSAATAEG